MPLWGRNCPLPALAALAILSLAGDGPVHSWLAVLSPLVCERAWQCLNLGLFSAVALPRSGLLSQVSFLRLPSGHSGLVLTLSNAAHASLFSPHSLVVDVSVWATSPLGVSVRRIICGFYLFFPPSYVAL